MALALWAPLTVFAADATASTEIGSGVVQMLLGLGAVLLTLFVALHIIKRLAGPRGMAAAMLRVVAATQVGPRERVVIVEVGESWLVLGVAPGRVNALHTLPRQDAALTLPAAAKTGGAGEFASRLAGLLARKRHER